MHFIAYIRQYGALSGVHMFCCLSARHEADDVILRRSGVFLNGDDAGDIIGDVGDISRDFIFPVRFVNKSEQFEKATAYS